MTALARPLISLYIVSIPANMLWRLSFLNWNITKYYVCMGGAWYILVIICGDNELYNDPIYLPFVSHFCIILCRFLTDHLKWDLSESNIQVLYGRKQTAN